MHYHKSIPLSGSKLFFTAIGALVFASVGFWFILSETSNFFMRSLGFATFVFFLPILPIMLKKLWAKKPGLAFSKKGIHDNSSAISAHTIYWKDIKHIDVAFVSSNKFIMVYVYNPETYLAKANWFKRFWMKLNQKFYGTPLTISAGTLDIQFEKLVKTIQEQFEQYNNSNLIQ